MPAASVDRDKGFFGHPSGLSTLFFTEMWERLSYYGGRTFLAIYMVTPLALGGRGMSDIATGTVMALYLSSVYLLSLPGGWIADRFIGQRKAITLGGIGILAGNAMLAAPIHDLFYPGLALIAVGTGFLKTNASTVVGQLYRPDDIRRDSGYTIYYMGINLGAGLAPLVGMLIAQNQSFRHLLERHGFDPNLCWNIGFAIPAIGMSVGVIQYLLGQQKLGDAGLHPTIPSDPKKAASDRTALVAITGGLVALIVAGIVVDRFVHQLSGDVLVNAFGIGLILAAIAIFAGFYRTARDAGERRRVSAMIPLFIGCIAFFAVSEQASTTLSLFAERLVRREYLGLHIVASAYQFINAGLIVALASGFAVMWLRLARTGKEPSTVNKFAIGMVLTAVSFVVMLPTLSTVTVVEGLNQDYLFAFPYRTVSPNFLIVLYFFTTCAELCISPVGLSSMSKLAPARIAGMVMGTWFLGVSIGNYLAGRAAGLSASHGYGFLFVSLIIASLLIAAALFAVAPMIRRMMQGDRPADLPKAIISPRAEDVAPAEVRSP
jgi:POT family proton-dependent oligopeptide transporter